MQRPLGFKDKLPSLSIDRTINTDQDTQSEKLMEVLADQSRQLREKYPDIFEKVDEILARPKRHAQSPAADISEENYRRRLRECAWCGNWFILDTPSSKQKTCSNSCGSFYKRWRERRERKRLREIRRKNTS